MKSFLEMRERALGTYVIVMKYGEHRSMKKVFKSN